MASRAWTFMITLVVLGAPARASADPAAASPGEDQTAPAAPTPPPLPASAPAAGALAPEPRNIQVSPPRNSATPTRACECRRETEPAEGAGAFFIGAGWFDFAALNRRLRAAGYEAIDRRMTLLGAEGHAVMPSGFLVGAHGGALLSPDGSGPNGLERTFGGGFGMLDLGFAVVRRTHVLVSVMSGIGGYGLSLGLSDGQSVPFDAVLANPRRSSSLSRGGVLVGLGVGLDGRVPIGPAERDHRAFFILGVRAGGMYGPPLGGWNASEIGHAGGGPGGEFAGAYAAFVLGFGDGPTHEPPLTSGVAREEE